jgi:hypothetical protein
VQLTVYNIGGCVTFAVNVHRTGTDIFIPDIFSPNGDGNDVLFVRGAGSRVYDRWAASLEAADNSQGWDGNTSRDPHLRLCTRSWLEWPMGMR